MKTRLQNAVRNVFAAILLIVAAPRPAGAWTVRNMSSSAAETNSLRFVANEINAGSFDTSVYFDVTNPPPRVFTFSADFTRRVTFTGSPDVLLANEINFYKGADILSVVCSNAVVRLYGSGGYVWNSRFTGGGVTLYTNYLFEAANSAVGTAFSLSVSNTIQG
ncbi:hypothetical protein GX586_10125, partial [bacterium]|nr:hypothetical protein [bacterium]